MSAITFAFIFISFAFVSQAVAHALRTTNETKKSKKISIAWHTVGALFIAFFVVGVSQLNYDYFVVYDSVYDTTIDKLWSVGYNVIYVMLIRFSLFNPIYNITSGHNLLYAGESNNFDNIENWIKCNFSNILPIFARVLVYLVLLSQSFV